MNSENFHDSLNEYNEKMQCVGGIALNLDYWDCECEHNYIHPIEQQVCKKCDSTREDSPSSREDEVKRYVHREIT